MLDVVGAIQMDLSYIMLLTHEGESVRLYKESYRMNHVEHPRNPNNQVKIIEESMGSYMVMAAKVPQPKYVKGL